MISFDERTGNMTPTDLGRVASHYYIQHETIQLFNEELKSTMQDADLLDLVARSEEFSNIKLREEEMEELETLFQEYCVEPIKGGKENPHGKINILLQAYLSQAELKAFSLVSDCAYVVQNVARLFRGLFEISLKKGWTVLATKLLNFCKMVDRRLWNDIHPLRQFPNLPPSVLDKLEAKKISIESLLEMKPQEIGDLVHNTRAGSLILKCAKAFPQLNLEVNMQPITRMILRVQLTVTPNFVWKDTIHGTVEPWWIWVEDPENEHIYHYEYFLLNKKQKAEPQILSFIIPLIEPLPAQYLVRAVSDRWLGAETCIPMSFKQLILPDLHIPHTQLLDLQPLPLTALHRPEQERLYNFSHFNPIQTQVFHTMLHTDYNVLLGAPTGSGKTIVAEMAMFRIFNQTPHLKVVYIAPLKALVRERMRDWNEKFVKKLKKQLVELTGDFTPDVRALKTAHIVATTPEKWDGISRCWQQRPYVKQVGLLIIDEIHLLGEERGPILEVIVSRMRYIASQTKTPIRIVGLSTAMANAKDLADWLGVELPGLFNFHPSVRPVPLEVHVTVRKKFFYLILFFFSFPFFSFFLF
jgi:activating signal cointegrator complex subunit 3